MNEDKAQLETIAKASRCLAGIDLLLAVICAANGNNIFALFMLLGGAMWAYGQWLQSRADEIGD